jgi:hypothetical protein
MLRISIKDKPNALHLKLEGKLIPPWTNELELVWSKIADCLDGRQLHLDLCETTFIDQHGMHLLRNIVQTANPEIVTNSPLTRQFADQARIGAQV